MGFRKCATLGCPHQVREGLQRPSWDKGVHNQQKADGVFCWRCRRKQAPKKRKASPAKAKGSR